MHVILNGKFVKEANASISINNRGFRYGDGCFETLRLVNGNLPLKKFHFERLFHSLQSLQFSCPSSFTPGSLSEQIAELAAKNQHSKLARIRLTVFRGDGGLYDTENRSPNWLIQSWPLDASVNQLNSNGIVCGQFKAGFKAADVFANIKSNNYLLYAQAALFARQQHWNDALVLNHRQTIADATIANLFIIKGTTIITPPLSDGPVQGVMRWYLLEHLPSLQYTVLEQTISEPDLATADEAFLTNAIHGIKWVQSIDAYTYRLRGAAAIHQQLCVPLFT